MKNNQMSRFIAQKRYGVLSREDIRLIELKMERRRRIAILLWILFTTVCLAASMGTIEKFFETIYHYEDRSYRPMDLERGGKPHSIHTGKAPIKKIDVYIK